MVTSIHSISPQIRSEFISGSNLTGVLIKREALLLVMLSMIQVSVLDSKPVYCLHNKCLSIRVFFKVNYI